MFASQLQTVTSYTLLLQHHRNISGINQRAAWLHFHFDAHRLRQTHCLLCASATFSHSSSYVHMWCKSCCNCRLLRYNFRRHIRADVCSYPCAINCCAPASATLQVHEHDLSSLGTSSTASFSSFIQDEVREYHEQVFLFSSFQMWKMNNLWNLSIIAGERQQRSQHWKAMGTGDARLLFVRNLRDIIHGNVTFLSIHVWRTFHFLIVFLLFAEMAFFLAELFFCLYRLLASPHF